VEWAWTGRRSSFDLTIVGVYCDKDVSASDWRKKRKAYLRLCLGWFGGGEKSMSSCVTRSASS
jgi:hypothetical protein